MKKADILKKMSGLIPSPCRAAYIHDTSLPVSLVEIEKQFGSFALFYKELKSYETTQTPTTIGEITSVIEV